MSITYSDSLKQSGDLFKLAQRATTYLEEILDQAAERVSAEWGVARDDHGRDILALHLKDNPDEGSTYFAPGEMKRPSSLRMRLRDFWGDILQDRSHRLLRQLKETGQGNGGC